MPTVFEWPGREFHFFTIDRAELPHVHARRDRNSGIHPSGLPQPAISEQEANTIFGVINNGTRSVSMPGIVTSDEPGAKLPAEAAE